MKYKQQPLHELASEMPMYPQTMINVRLPRGTNAATVVELKAVKHAVSEAEAALADTGRVLLRPSGTEPVIRVMVEGQDDALVRSACEEISKVVKSQL
jgi:phosphoglucosamine mutase